MQMCLVQVPYTCGDEHQGASKGPERYVQAGVERLLAGKGAAVTVKRVERGAPFRDSASSSLADCKQIAMIVREAVTSGQFPLILAGSCDVSKGILSGFDHAHCGIIWIDAHGDFNTPETTISGFFPGMSLAIITGHCYQNYWAQIGNSSPISEAATLMLGVRDLDPAERERLELSAIQVVNWREGKPQADVLASLDELAKRVREIYLHVDMDALDPRVAPGIVDHPVPGGLSLQDMEEAIRAVAARFRIRAAALATYNPDLDQDEKTSRAGLRIIELLAECAGDAPPSNAATRAWCALEGPDD
jgi:arginase